MSDNKLGKIIGNQIMDRAKYDYDHAIQDAEIDMFHQKYGKNN